MCKNAMQNKIITTKTINHTLPQKEEEKLFIESEGMFKKTFCNKIIIARFVFLKLFRNEMFEKKELNIV